MKEKYKCEKINWKESWLEISTDWIYSDSLRLWLECVVKSVVPLLMLSKLNKSLWNETKSIRIIIINCVHLFWLSWLSLILFYFTLFFLIHWDLFGFILFYLICSISECEKLTGWVFLLKLEFLDFLNWSIFKLTPEWDRNETGIWWNSSRIKSMILGITRITRILVEFNRNNQDPTGISGGG